ncbi:uncharacterized protein PGTG_00643 [Puccinia graminis f. sp. tritici CRL 75-36-700-3]|uniref:Uncharacterized protein n=1 Tax=Puccinia graminis f. sp. tritici (strain CRL 75-36-700-3 / race SCCL) TaxID=418459 RepID=E3JQN8_PUCGT|nr:uncharacterized protein PGTG_00643 [Puccinia graminis f. sp. tritici CRL 75-36-700-3]EFP74687.2 hypothetical protein PGTG_00643 [Puccinia graminis f. sp. tritici CRL 75-36-700-3]
MDPSETLVTRPLIPIQATSIHLTDLILPPLLIGLALMIFDIQSRKITKKTSSNSHLFINQTHHARFLPSSSTHQFKYSLIQFGLDLDHLEAAQLDIPHLFRFSKPKNDQLASRFRLLFDPSSWLNLIQIFSISPSSYFKNTPSNNTHQAQSIKLALFNQLETQFDLDPHQEIGKVYLLSMPTYLGFTSINPLSIYFCYQKPVDPSDPNHPPLKYVVLDVQNTFSERHSYLLKIGTNELPNPQSGFQHEWIIPRAFHVSPFNDRTGSYKISLSDPFSNPKRGPDGQSTISLNFKIVFLTKSGEKKFIATLNGTGAPFTTSNLVRIWAQYPVVLFLTSLRILYESFKLHMGKPRLDVYPRPEPVFDREYALKGPNPIQEGGQLGATGWQEADWCSRWAQRIVVDYLTRRVNQIAENSAKILQATPHPAPKSSPDTELTSLGSFVNLADNSEKAAPDRLSEEEEEEEEQQRFNSTERPSVVTVVLQPADQTQQIITISPPPAPSDDHDQATGWVQETLTIHYGSAGFFTDLIVFPTPSLAQLIGDESEAAWKVSSMALFDRVFENAHVRQCLLSRDSQPPVRLSKPAGFLARLINRLRRFYFRWLLSFISLEERNSAQIKRRSSWFPPPNFVAIDGPFQCDSSPIDRPFLHSNLTQAGRIFCILLHQIFSELLSFFLFHYLFRFRFVGSKQPWWRLKRAIFAANRIPFNAQPDLDLHHIGSLRHPS